MTPKAQPIKEKNDEPGFVESKSFSSVKSLLREWKYKLQAERVFANDTSNKGFVSDIYKELSKLNSKGTIQIKNKLRIDISLKRI